MIVIRTILAVGVIIDVIALIVGAGIQRPCKAVHVKTTGVAFLQRIDLLIFGEKLDNFRQFEANCLPC